MKKRLTAVILSAVLLMTAVCSIESRRNQPETITFLGLDTIISITGRGRERTQALNEIQENITQMEQELSRTRPDSRLFQINHAGEKEVRVSPELYLILEQAEQVSRWTEGAFDVTIAPAADLWGFTKDEFRVPSEEELEAVRSRVGMEHLTLGEGTIKLSQGAQLDLGGIAKGYALEQAEEVFRKHSMKGGIANLGGDGLLYGTGPQGNPWRIAIRDPEYRESGSDILGILSVTDRYVLTSGGYERYFEQDGRTYQHIIDPSDCAPAESDLESVTIVSSLEQGAGIKADALATALFVMGYRKAVDFWRSSQFQFDMILVGTDGTVSVTKGLEPVFSLQNPSRYQYQILSEKQDTD